MEAKQLVDELRGNDPIATLEKFLSEFEVNDAKKFIKDFLQESPNFEVLLELLDQEKWTKGEMMTIFDALGSCLMSLSTDSDMESVCRHVAQFVLKSHCKYLQTMLSPTNANQSVIAALKVITGLIVSSVVTAAEVLMQLDLDKIEFVTLAKKEEVRIHLIYMTLAVLNTNDAGCLCLFLNKPYRVTCIFEGLVHDPVIVIVRFLNLMRDCVLNIKITKTLKTKIFNADSCKHFTTLYFYTNNSKKHYNSEEFIEIKNALHKLMISLCTDIKYGIIFKEKENKIPGKHDNWHVYLILCTIKYPWQFEEGRDLVARVLKVSPAVAELYQVQMKSHFVPRDHHGFFSLSKLFILIIENREPWIELEDMFLKRGSLKEFSFSIPFGKIKDVTTIMLEHSSVVVRHFGLLILVSYFNKAKETILKIEEKAFLNNEYQKQFKDKILDEIESLEFRMSKLCSLWHNCTTVGIEFQVPPEFKSECSSPYCILVDISQLLCSYMEIYGYKFVRRVFSPLNMLLKLKNLPINDSTVESSLKINILKLILKGQKINDFEAFGFIKDKSNENGEEITINETLFTALIEIYCTNSSSSSASASDLREELKTLCLLLLNSSLDCWGLSSYCKNFIEVWLDKIDSNNQKICTEFFAKVVSISIHNLYLYLDVLIAMNTEIEDNKSSIPLNILDIVNQMDPSIEIKDNEDVNLSAIKIPFSCLILGALDVLKADPNVVLINYFMNVVDDYMYRLDHPEILSQHLLDNNILSVEMKEYLTFWSTRQHLTPRVFSESGTDQPSLMSELKTIFMGEDIPILSTFCCNLQNRLSNPNELEYICRQLYVYIHSEYCISQNANKKQPIEKKKVKFFVNVFRKLLKLTQTNLNSNKFLSLFDHLLNHSFTLRNYDPFNLSNTIQKVIDNILCIVLENYPTLHSYVKPFLEKYIYFLNKHSDKEELLNMIPMYLDNFKQLSFSELERISISLLSWKTVSENYIHIMSKIFDLLKTHSSVSHQPSKDLISLVIAKMIHVTKRKNNSEEELQVYQILSDYSRVIFIPNVVENFEPDDLMNILKGRISDSTLINILLHINSSVLDTLVESLNGIKVHLSCQVPFILSVIKKEDDKHQQQIHSYLLRIKDSLMEWILNPNSDMNDDYQNVIEYMLQSDLFQPEEIIEIYNKFLSKEFETPRHILSLLPFFESIAVKHNNNNNNADDITHPYIQLLTFLMRGVVKMYGKKEEEPKFVGAVGDVIIKITSKLDAKFLRKEYYDNKLWQRFVKKVLKESLTDDENGSKLLDCLVQLAKQIYSKRKKEESSVPPKILYQMLRSHSQFVAVMLNHEGNDAIKEQVSLLQLTLVELCPDVCEERHIPLLLGAYGASFSKCDQYILKILYLYELKGYMPTFEPNFWGQAAVAHFALSTGADGNSEYRTPKIVQILPLIDSERVIETALNFNMELELQPTTVVEITNPALYDQRFLLSLFLYFCSVDRINVMNLAEKGIVAIGIAALTSHCEDVWAAGSRLLQYAATSFEKSKYYNLKLQWMWLIGVLGYGLDGTKQRIPSMTSHFFIRASQLLLNPQDLMYKPVMNYLYLRPSLPLFKVPEFYNFFYSQDVKNNKIHRSFLFDLMAGGIRDDSDFLMCQMLYVPNIILAACKSPTVDTRLRVMALNVLNSMVKIPNGAFHLVYEHSLLEVLPHAIHPSTRCPSDKQRFWIEAVIEILTSLWRTWKTSQLDYKCSETNLDIELVRKRKREESINNNECSFSKKRKISNGHFSEGENLQVEKKTKITDKTEAGLVDILRCIGCIFGQVLKEGTIESISNLFLILKEMVIYFEALEREDRYSKPPIIRSKFARHQILLWMKNSNFVKRFQGSFNKEEAYYYGLVDISLDEWKFRPLVHEDGQESEGYKGIRTMIQRRKDLFDFLNSEFS